MIIWRGWGVLALLLIIVGVGIGGAAGSRLGKPGAGIAVALGMLAGSAACWFVGQKFNVTDPAQKLAAYTQARGAELHQHADAGTFHLGAGFAAPTSLAEAHAQADQLLAAETAQLQSKGRNFHTLMFIPMQYWAFLGGGLSLILLVTALVR